MLTSFHDPQQSSFAMTAEVSLRSDRTGETSQCHARSLILKLSNVCTLYSTLTYNQI